MSSKYGFLTRAEIDVRSTDEAAAIVDGAETAKRDQVAKAVERQLRQDEARALLLTATIARIADPVVDIVRDYLQAEFGVDPSIRTHAGPPDLHLWQFWVDPDLLFEAFLLVQGLPVEAGLFVAIEKKDSRTGQPGHGENLPNLDRLLVVLREHCGIVARTCRRGSRLREIMEFRTGLGPDLDPRKPLKPPPPDRKTQQLAALGARPKTGTRKGGISPTKGP
jgi:hypothetical protein